MRFLTQAVLLCSFATLAWCICSFPKATQIDMALGTTGAEFCYPVYSQYGSCVRIEGWAKAEEQEKFGCGFQYCGNVSPKEGPKSYCNSTQVTVNSPYLTPIKLCVCSQDDMFQAGITFFRACSDFGVYVTFENSTFTQVKEC